MSTKGIKIISDGTAMNTQICDAETGDVLKSLMFHVTGITWQVDGSKQAGERQGEIGSATLDLQFVPVQVIGRLNPDTIREKIAKQRLVIEQLEALLDGVGSAVAYPPPVPQSTTLYVEPYTRNEVIQFIRELEARTYDAADKGLSIFLTRRVLATVKAVLDGKL